MIPRLLRRLGDLPIRYKFLLPTAAVFALLLTLAGGVTYSLVRQSLERNIERELQNSTTAIRNLVQTAVTGSIRNYLRAVADRNVEVVEHLYGRYRAGALTEEQARRRAEELILAQTIGQTGYVCCLDSRGVVVVHPERELLQRNLSEQRFVRELMERRRGYQEYQWRNPGEDTPQAKAMYMAYFAPWDWIVTVVAYRSEFVQLVNVDDFRDSILSLKFGASGYAFVADAEGRAIIHPKMQGADLTSGPDGPTGIYQAMRSRQSGRVRYAWQNPGEPRARQKLVIFDHIPELDWIVASSSYLDEAYAPLDRVRDWFAATFAVSLLLALPLAFRISASITRPLRQLTEGLARGTDGGFAQRMPVRSDDEVGRLAAFFNRFMEQLAVYSSDLESEVAERRQVEAALRESEERYRSVMEAAPDPVAVYDMEGRVIYLNPAFTTAFGWSLQECRGRRLDHFVPAACWPETREGIRRILAGQTLSGIRTQRRTRSGDVRDISISGAPFRGSDGELAGSVMILREVTEKVRAERALALSEEMFSKAFRLSPSGVAIVTLGDRTLLNVNEAFLALAGRTREEARGRTLSDLGLFTRPADIDTLLQRLDREGLLRDHEVEFQTPGGDRRLGRVSAERIEEWDEPCMLATVEDITDARRLEREVIDSGDRERRRIGRGLHDDLAPHLIGIEVLGGVLEKRLAGNTPEAAASAAQIRGLIADAIEKTRALARGLGTVHLSAAGLGLALQELAADTERIYGVACRFRGAEEVVVEADAVATQLFYVAREAVHNAVKHAAAGCIEIELDAPAGGLALRVRDDGVGLAAPSAKDGMGLRIMAFRARMIDAALALDSAPGAGTAWTLTRPRGAPTEETP
jgi:PAS domain S-box-containing protein